MGIEEFDRALGEYDHVAPNKDRRLSIHHFLKIIKISEIKTLMMIMVVSGKKNVNPGRLMTMSPGSRPSGSFETHGQARPTTAMSKPRTMRERCISEPSIQTISESTTRSVFAQGGNASGKITPLARYKLAADRCFLVLVTVLRAAEDGQLGPRGKL
jgi:hypothetical protein